jgi:site-specific DNA recombinase
MAIQKALAYARVSTMEQAEANLSIPAQLKEINKYAAANNIEVIHEYVDEGLSAYKDDYKRIAFNQMTEHAKSSIDINLILVHEFSRFSRDRYYAVSIKGELKKAGVRVVSTSLPYDSTTTSGTILETLDEGLSQITSMQISEHTIKGMKENAVTRDPETGYCYKNGGRAPYGYSLKRVPAGKDKKGQQKFKLLWEVNPETSKILRMIIVDLRIGEGLSYKKIRDRLNEAGIPGPEGNHWSDTTLREMLVDNRLDQYAGIYYWNKEDHSTQGKRYKDRSEWITADNAHPAIITKDEVEAALAVTKSRQPRTPAARSYNSPWPLTGSNTWGEKLFICNNCGQSMKGIKSGVNDSYSYYVCSSFYNKGKSACDNNKRINRTKIEKDLLSEIKNAFGTPDNTSELFSKLNQKLGCELAQYNNLLQVKMKDIELIDKKIDTVFFALSEGLDSETCNQRLMKLKEEKYKAESALKNIELEKPQSINIDPNQAKKLFEDLHKLYEVGTNEQRSMLYKTYIKKLVFDAKLNKVNITFSVENLQEIAKRGVFTPRYTTNGVGRGT